MTADARDLLVRAQAGDADAFAAFYARWRPYVCGIIRHRIMNDPGLVDDLTQETFIRAWRGRDTYRPAAPALAWLAAIAHNTTIDHYRSRAWNREARPAGVPVDEMYDLPDRADRIGEVDTRAQVATVLDALTDEHRQVMVLHYLAEMSSPEIAAYTGVDPATVRTRLCYARRAARKLAGVAPC